MKIYCNQLRQQLKKTLAPIYLLVGEEPLQKMEAGDLIRRTAAEAGYTGHRVFFMNQDGDWDAFKQATANRSLFSEKFLLDLRVVSAVGKTAAAALKAYAENPQEDTIVLIRANRLDARTAWVKSMTKQGVLVQIYGKNLAETKAWIRERAQAMGLRMEDQVADTLATHLEGNLTAAAQELSQLALLYSDKMIRQEHAAASLNERSLYSGFDFADAVVVGDGTRAVRIIRGLQSDGQPPVLIVNALASQLRTLVDMETQIAQGEDPQSLLARVWRSKRAVFSQALARRRGARFWQNGLRWCAEVDKAAKGMGVHQDWEILFDLTLRLTRQHQPTVAGGAQGAPLPREQRQHQPTVVGGAV